MPTTTLVLVIAAIAVAAAIAFVMLRGRRAGVPVAASNEDDDPAMSATGEAMIVGDVVPIDSGEPTIPPGTAQPPLEDAATRRAGVRWPKRFESANAPFDDATRLSLLHDLGIVRAPWGVPLLTQAYEEEPAPEHRRAALRALAAYRHPDTQSAFELALHEDEDEESRAIAATALSALRIRAALPS